MLDLLIAITMHLHKSLMILTCVSCTLFAAGQNVEYQIPPLLGVGGAGWVASELIYSLDSKPTPQCHASTIVELTDGLMVAWFGGTHEKNPDVGIWTSQRRNDVWTHPVQVANGFVNDSLRYPCWNPVLFKSSKGPVMLFYKVGPNPSDWWGML